MTTQEAEWRRLVAVGYERGWLKHRVPESLRLVDEIIRKSQHIDPFRKRGVRTVPLDWEKYDT